MLDNRPYNARMTSGKQKNIEESLRWAANSFLLESLFEQSPLGLFVVDEKFRFVKVSKYFAHNINDQSVEAHLGKTIRQVVGPQQWPKLKPFFQRALVGEYIHDVHVTMNRRKDSHRERHYLVTLYPLPKIEQGKLIGGLIQEITRQYEAEEEVLTYQNRLEMAQNAGGIGVFDWDFETNEVWSSPEEVALFELNERDPSGREVHWLDRIHPQDKDRILSLIEESSEKHQNFDTEFRIILPDSQLRWIRGRGRFFYNEEGEAVQLLGVNYDITKRKKEELFLKFKSEASRLLIPSTDYQKTLQQMCELAVKFVADWCSVDILEGETFQQLALAHKDPEMVEYAKKIRSKMPATLQTSRGLAQVVKTQKPLFISEVTSDLLDQENLSPEQRRIAKKLKLNSVIIYPLCVQQKAVGAITFVLAESEGHYSEDDLEWIRQLSLRVSLFVENTQLYDEIRKERQRLFRLFENVPCVVFESHFQSPNQPSRITFMNVYVQELLGYPLETWMNKEEFAQSIIHPEDVKRFETERQKVIRERTPGLVRFRWRKKDGKYIWVESRFLPILDKHDEVVGFRGVVTDISERMKLEQRKDEFIATASHELKTPLTSLKVFTQVLKTHKSIQASSKVSQYLNRMESEVDRLTELVYELLDLSKIQRGQLALNKEKLSLNELLAEVIQTIQPTIQHQIIFKSSKESYVHADRLRLSQVFSNLISNAAKYSPDASEIIIQLRQEDKKVTVSIQDFGIGIAPEYQTQIFQRFYRVFDEKDQTFPGLGMGLFISKTIINQHNGQIWVKSKPQNGSTFFVSLPRRKGV